MSWKNNRKRKVLVSLIRYPVTASLEFCRTSVFVGVGDVVVPLLVEVPVVDDGASDASLLFRDALLPTTPPTTAAMTTTTSTTPPMIHHSLLFLCAAATTTGGDDATIFSASTGGGGGGGFGSAGYRPGCSGTTSKPDSKTARSLWSCDR